MSICKHTIVSNMLRDNRNNCGSKGDIRLFIFTSQVHCVIVDMFSYHFLLVNQFLGVMVMVTFSLYSLFFFSFRRLFNSEIVGNFRFKWVCALIYRHSLRIEILKILLNIHRMKLSISCFGGGMCGVLVWMLSASTIECILLLWGKLASRSYFEIEWVCSEINKFRAQITSCLW